MEYRPTDGRIADRLNKESARGGREDAAEMTKSIRIEKRVLDVPPQIVKRWLSRFAAIHASPILAESPSHEKSERYVVLDGTTYELWHEGEKGKVHYSLLGSEIGDRHPRADHPLVTWMNSVRLDIERMKY